MASQTIDLSNVDKVDFVQGGVAKDVNIVKLDDTVIWRGELPEVMQDFIFTVKRYTTNTYVDETSYTNDEIIAFDVTAGEGGCTVTYGGVTTDIEANASQRLIYGKYKGVDDGTPASGTMTISGDYRLVTQALVTIAKTQFETIKNVTGIIQWFGSQLVTLNNFFSSAITSATIDMPIVNYKVNITDLTECFAYCKTLTSAPVNLIKQCEKVTTFTGCFAGCTGLTSIPENLFENNTAVTSFSECFRGCTGLTLTSIPENLFKNNSAVTSFSECFIGCTGLTSIPENLFKNNTVVTDFRACFANCTGLVEIPANLFRYNTEVTDFGPILDNTIGCFGHCTSLTYIPSNLFVNNLKVTSFKRCFYGCTGLTGTTPVNASGLELWELKGTTGYPDVITGRGCFASCTGLSNYSSIPDDWVTTNP